MMTPGEYHESMSRMNFRAYVMGERVEDLGGHPLVAPSRNAVAATYELGLDSKIGLGRCPSHMSGEQVSRFTHTHQSTNDLMNKVKMQRELGQAHRHLFSALRGHGRHQRAFFHHP